MRFPLTTGSLIVLTLCCFSSTVYSQFSERDSINYQVSVRNALSVYHNSLNKPSGLYNGGQYIQYANLIKDDHPYFKSDSMTSGTIVYDSVTYEKIPMFYDLVKELVVINDPYNIYKLSLIKEKVNAFSILNHNFIRIETDSSTHSNINTGYYDLLYKGKVNLYERELKKMQETINGGELTRIIIPENNFYLEIDGRFHRINRKASLLKLLSQRKKDIQQFIRKNKLNYRTDKENTLIKVVAYYDSLPATTKNQQ